MTDSALQDVVGWLCVAYVWIVLFPFVMYCANQFYRHRHFSAIQKRHYSLTFLGLVGTSVYVFVNGLRTIEYVALCIYILLRVTFTLFTVYVYERWIYAEHRSFSKWFGVANAVPLYASLNGCNWAIMFRCWHLLFDDMYGIHQSGMKWMRHIDVNYVKEQSNNWWMKPRNHTTYGNVRWTTRRLYLPLVAINVVSFTFLTALQLLSLLWLLRLIGFTVCFHPKSNC